MWQVVFANVSVEGRVDDPDVYGSLMALAIFWPSLAMILKFSNVVLWPVIFSCSKMGDGALRCSLYLSSKVLADSPIYSSSHSVLPHLNQYMMLLCFENIINILWNTLDRKGNFPQWDSNLMPLVCWTSALTARPQRNPNLSQITYPSDSCVVTELWPNYLQSIVCASHPCISIYHCTSVLHICLDGLPSSK